MLNSWYRPNFEVLMKRAGVPYLIDDSKCTQNTSALEKQLQCPMSESLKAFVSDTGSLELGGYRIHIEPSLGNLKGIVLCKHQEDIYLYNAAGKVFVYSADEQDSKNINGCFDWFTEFITHCAFGSREFDLNQLMNEDELGMFMTWLKKAIAFFQDPTKADLFSSAAVSLWSNHSANQTRSLVFTRFELLLAISMIYKMCWLLDPDLERHHEVSSISDLCAKLETSMDHSIIEYSPPLLYGKNWDKDWEIIRQGGVSRLYLSNEDEDGWLPIHCAAKQGDFDALKWMWEKDPILLEVQVDHGETCLHFAAYNGDLRMARWILEKAPKLLDLPNSHGELPIHEAAQSGHLELIKLFVEKDPTLLYCQGNFEQDYPIHMAVRGGYQKSVDWMLSYDFSLSYVLNREGESYLDAL